MKRRRFIFILAFWAAAGLLSLCLGVSHAADRPPKVLAGELGDVVPKEGQKSKG